MNYAKNRLEPDDAMPRRTRTKLMRRAEAWERHLRERSLQLLAITLHREWRERQAAGDLDVWDALPSAPTGEGYAAR
jgi:hypothetical protein